MKGIGNLVRLISLAGLLLVSGTALAGPFADFERALGAAYAPYRAALFQTNQKNKAGTEASIAAFESQWGALMRTYRSSPPPQYADDPKWTEAVTGIDRTIAAAKAEVAKGELAKAHDILEAIRVELGALRVRNGVIAFSDHVDAYHEKMEQVLTAKYGDDTARLREDAAVLMHLAGHIRERIPAGLAKDADFAEALQAMAGAAESLLGAARRGDKAAIEKAMKGLKPAYARFFVKYG